MNLSHVNIITCVDLYQNTEYIHIVMEYCPGKTLFDIVEQHSRIPETKARRLFQQVQRYKDTDSEIRPLEISKIT